MKSLNFRVYAFLIKYKKKYQIIMGSKFFGNRMEKQTPGKKGAKQKFANKNNNAKSGGVRKVGRGS